MLLLWRRGEHAKRSNYMQGHVAIDAPGETNDAQLFAQSAHAPDQTGQRSRLLHCLAGLAVPPAPLCHLATGFFMKFRGPQALDNRPGGLSYDAARRASLSRSRRRMKVSISAFEKTKPSSVGLYGILLSLCI